MFFSVYVFGSRFICVQNVMYAMLATFQQFNFCYLLRFIIVSSVHRAFPHSIDVHAQNIEGQKFLLKKCQKSFDTGIMKKLGKFLVLDQKHFFY